MSDPSKDSDDSAKPLGQSLKDKGFNPLYLLAAVPVVMLFGLCMCCGVFGIIGKGGSGSASIREAPDEEVTRIRANQLFSEYEANDIAGDKKYKGKILEVSGYIDTISRDFLNNIYITLEAGGEFEIFNIQCYFADDQEDRVADLTPGQSITVRGRCKGKFGNVSIEDCIIIE